MGKRLDPDAMRRPRPDVPACYDLAYGPPDPHYRRPLTEWDDPTWYPVTVDPEFMDHRSKMAIIRAQRLARDLPLPDSTRPQPAGYVVCRDVPGGALFLADVGDGGQWSFRERAAFTFSRKEYAAAIAEGCADLDAYVMAVFWHDP